MQGLCALKRVELPHESHRQGWYGVSPSAHSHVHLLFCAKGQLGVACFSLTNLPMLPPLKVIIFWAGLLVKVWKKTLILMQYISAAIPCCFFQLKQTRGGGGVGIGGQFKLIVQKIIGQRKCTLQCLKATIRPDCKHKHSRTILYETPSHLSG